MKHFKHTHTLTKLRLTYLEQRLLHLLAPFEYKPFYDYKIDISERRVKYGRYEFKAEVRLDGVLLASYNSKHVIRKIASALTDTQNVPIEVKKGAVRMKRRKKWFTSEVDTICEHLAKASDLLDDLSAIQDDKNDNYPENLQGSYAYDKMLERYDAFIDAKDGIDEFKATLEEMLDE